MVSAHEYRDDDVGYGQWLDACPGGYVLNVAASFNPADAKMHLSNCPIIRPRDGRSATGPYVKVCAPQRADLERWAAEHMMPLPPACGTCHRAERAAGPVSAWTHRRGSAPLLSPAAASSRAQARVGPLLRPGRRTTSGTGRRGRAGNKTIGGRALQWCRQNPGDNARPSAAFRRVVRHW